MTTNELNSLLETVITASLLAGKGILEVYESEIAVQMKEDRSPLTEADQRSHLKLMEFLTQTDIPILSEEGKDIAYNDRSAWDWMWIVDPLDGTKEFIKRNGEFTTNVALINGQKAVMGVIYVPVLQTLYFGHPEIGAWKTENVAPEGISRTTEEWMAMPTKLPQVPTGAYKVVGSRSHMSPETEEFVEALKKEHGEIEVVSMGSSLKICLVAEGAANVYPRFAPTMEWDTAAGQAIAQAAGKEVVSHSTGSAMLYNKENLLNDWFIVR